MNIEILFQNGIFLSLFFSMISFWSQNLFPNSKTILPQGFPKENQIPRISIINTGTNSIFFAEKLFFLSFILITCELIYRWFLSGHPPLSNLYESLLFLIWGVIGFFLFIYSNEKSNEFRVVKLDEVKSPPVKLGKVPPLKLSKTQAVVSFTFQPEEAIKSSVSDDLLLTKSILKSKGNFFSEDARSFNQTSNFSTRNFIGSILSSTALFIQTFADWRLPSDMREIKPLIPALQSNWLLMHVSIMILSYAALLIGCIISITYIVIVSQSDNKKIETNNFQNILFLDELDSLSYRILAFGFPLLTLGILSGAVWANEAWGSYWSWDPKETWAFITWLVFAFYLHTRLQYGWEGKKSATVAMFGFFIVWICYLGVNLLGKGLHSYGWLS
jgi:cytochrome c-type biogenesis protein CcsB